MSKPFNNENLWVQILLVYFTYKNALVASQAKISDSAALPGTALVAQGNMYSSPSLSFRNTSRSFPTPQLMLTSLE